MLFTTTSYGMMEYDGTPVRDLILRDAPDAPLSEYLVYVMSAYTAYNLQQALGRHEEQIDLPELYPPDALFDPMSMSVWKRPYGTSVARFASDECAAFIATDVDIPTITEAQDENLDEPGMTPLEQSIAFARESNAVVFVFPYAGIPPASRRRQEHSVNTSICERPIRRSERNHANGFGCSEKRVSGAQLLRSSNSTTSSDSQSTNPETYWCMK